MKFRGRNLKELALAVNGNTDYFIYRSSSYMTDFFDDCSLPYCHDGSTRWSWTADRLEELLQNPQPNQHELPVLFVHVLRTLMLKADADPEDPDRSLALSALNKPLTREGFEAYYGEDDLLYINHIGTQTISNAKNPHRPFTPQELERRELMVSFLNQCSEDELIEDVLLPMFRQLGYHRISAAGHKDKALEYGKDIWMRYVLPTQHVLYFGIQVKKGKLCLLYTSPSPRDATLSRMPSSA